MTTTKIWELHNVKKCLAAGYDLVIAVPVDKKAAQLMAKVVAEGLSAEQRAKVYVMEADALFQYLDSQTTKEVPKEKRIKGYRVKVEYDAVSDEITQQKRESVTKFVSDRPTGNKKNKKDTEKSV